MNLSKIYIQIIIIGLVTNSNILLSSAPVVLNRPNKYLRPFLFNDYKPVLSEEINNLDPWEVFVTTDRKKTFNNNTDRVDFKELSYLQKFYAYEEDGEYLRLCKLQNPEDTIISHSDDFGWIHKKNLLLSKRCFVTDERGWINRKVISLSNLNSTLIDSIDKRIYFKKGPGSEYENTGEYLSDSDIYFVFQKIRVSENSENKYKNWYFLGKRERYSNVNIEEILCGWVPEECVIEWNNNLLVSPNTDPLAIEERRGGKKIVFFKEQKDMWIFLRTGEILNEVWEENFSLYESDNPDLTKIWLPVIKNDNGIIEAAVNINGGSIFRSGDTNLVSQRGYFVDSMDAKKHDLFEISLLVSSDEWTVLNESILKMINVNSKEELIKTLTDFAVELVGKKDQKNCGYIRVTDLFSEMYGVVSENSVFNGMVINDINGISSNKLRNIIDNIEEKYYNLVQVVNDNDYKFSFKSHGINYYMIKAELFP